VALAHGGAVREMHACEAEAPMHHTYQSDHHTFHYANDDAQGK